MKVSAPGKLVLLGDYAVLDGAPALVGAVNRRAVGVLDPGGPPSEVVDAVLARAGVRTRVRIDTGGFVEPAGEKLGLGSSSAVAVVTAALATGVRDERCFALALDGHRDAAGGVGSGIDVAACFHGGVIATARQPAEVRPLPTRIPGLHLSVLYANQSASTSSLVRACRTSPRWTDWVAVMRTLAEEGIDAWAGQDADGFTSIVARYGRAMAGLGRDAGVGVVTPPIEAIMAAAERGGGAAKPSGAGGGDVVVLFSADAELGARVAEETGTRLVDLSVDPAGLRVER